MTKDQIDRIKKLKEKYIKMTEFRNTNLLDHEEADEIARQTKKSFEELLDILTENWSSQYDI